ncbi:MAG: VTT domain-containing protein, partial [Lachnospiraceae bacterium]|nr:VTT domain-containing protein [Lachnospiraceae bacterium]
MPNHKKIGPVGIALLVGAILFLFVFFLKDLLIPLLRLELAKDVDGAAALIRDRGIQGYLTVILVEALQMVVVFIPAEFIQISAALSFPFPLAVLLCDLGVCLGASIIFVLVRVYHIRNDAYEKREQSIAEFSDIVHERNTIFLLYFLFIMPLIPFGAICYYGSGKKLPFGKYIRTVATGVLPSIVTSNLMGAAGLAFLRSRLPLWVLVLIIVFFALLLFIAGILVIRRFYFRDKAG